MRKLLFMLPLLFILLSCSDLEISTSVICIENTTEYEIYVGNLRAYLNDEYICPDTLVLDDYVINEEEFEVTLQKGESYSYSFVYESGDILTLNIGYGIMSPTIVASHVNGEYELSSAEKIYHIYWYNDSTTSEYRYVHRVEEVYK